MDINKITNGLKEKMAFMKKHSFGDRIMRKKTFSTMEKVLTYSSIGIASFIIAVFFVIVPGVNDIQLLQQNISNAVLKIYGDDTGEEGVKFVHKRIQEQLNEETGEFEEKEKLTLEKYDQALPKNIDISNIAVFLEDYTVTLHTKEKPIVLSNISFGKPEEKELSLDDLRQDNSDGRIIIPAEYRSLPVNISLDAHRMKFEQFLDFVYHSGDTEQYYFKGNPVPVMSIESLNLPVLDEEEKDNIEVDGKPVVEVESYSLKLNLYFQKKEELKVIDS
ncbi:hypothetical protein HON22_05340 [Candidatus Peregrinibacteria bacterium]|jgi:hypothetical protein|nr:hypothetical protein [Candidatus Peregrinibacteria bacterium]